MFLILGLKHSNFIWFQNRGKSVKGEKLQSQVRVIVKVCCLFARHGTAQRTRSAFVKRIGPVSIPLWHIIVTAGFQQPQNPSVPLTAC